MPSRDYHFDCFISAGHDGESYLVFPDNIDVEMYCEYLNIAPQVYSFGGFCNAIQIKV